MEYRSLGGTGLRVSALGFGCGNIGGLLIRGSVAERERAVARAIELGINYFDTAASYGDGQSEEHLGRALRALKVSPCVGTKVRVPDVPVSALAGAVARGLEESLRRLGRDRVDLFQLHNHVTAERTSESLTAKDVRDVVFPAMARLAEQGKIGFHGITALGQTASVLDVIGAGRASAERAGRRGPRRPSRRGVAALRPGRRPGLDRPPRVLESRAARVRRGVREQGATVGRRARAPAGVVDSAGPRVITGLGEGAIDKLRISDITGGQPGGAVMSDQRPSVSRRTFLRTLGIASGGAVIAPAFVGTPASAQETASPLRPDPAP